MCDFSSGRRGRYCAALTHKSILPIPCERYPDAKNNTQPSNPIYSVRKIDAGVIVFEHTRQLIVRSPHLPEGHDSIRVGVDAPILVALLDNVGTVISHTELYRTKYPHPKSKEEKKGYVSKRVDQSIYRLNGLLGIMPTSENPRGVLIHNEPKIGYVLYRPHC